MQVIFSNASDMNLNDILPHKSPLQASSSPIPRIRIWSIEHEYNLLQLVYSSCKYHYHLQKQNIASSAFIDRRLVPRLFLKISDKKKQQRIIIASIV